MKQYVQVEWLVEIPKGADPWLWKDRAAVLVPETFFGVEPAATNVRLVTDEQLAAEREALGEEA